MADSADKRFSKPKRPMVINIDGNAINDHDAGSQRTPDLASQDQKDQRAKNDEKHARYQVADEKRIAQSADSEIVHEHRGPPRDRRMVSPHKLGAKPFAVGPDHLGWALGRRRSVKRQCYDEVFTFYQLFGDSDAKTGLAVVQELAFEESFLSGKKNGPRVCLPIEVASFLRTGAVFLLNRRRLHGVISP